MQETYIEVEVGPLRLLRISVVLGTLFHSKGLPERVVFLALLQNLKLLIASLVALEQCSVGFCRFNVGFLIDLGEFITDPQEHGPLRLDNCHASWVKTLISIASLVKVLGHQLTDNALRVVVLVAHQAEDAWVNGKGKEVGVNEPLLPPH